MLAVTISMNRDLSNEGIECSIILTSENNPTYELHFSREVNFRLWFEHVRNLPGTLFDNRNTFHCCNDQWFEQATKLCFNADTVPITWDNGDMSIYYFETDEEYNSYTRDHFEFYRRKDIAIPQC